MTRCEICGKPYKPKSKKDKSVKNNNPLCSGCRKRRRDLTNTVFKKTNGKVKFVSVKDLLNVKKHIGNEDVFEYIENVPYSVYRYYKKR